MSLVVVPALVLQVGGSINRLGGWIDWFDRIHLGGGRIFGGGGYILIGYKVDGYIGGGLRCLIFPWANPPW